MSLVDSEANPSDPHYQMRVKEAKAEDYYFLNNYKDMKAYKIEQEKKIAIEKAKREEQMLQEEKEKKKKDKMLINRLSLEEQAKKVASQAST